MDSIEDLLGKYTPREPAEVTAIKDYVSQSFNVSVGVGIKGDTIVITASNAALANTLRFKITQLRTAANTDKKLVIRIG